MITPIISRGYSSNAYVIRGEKTLVIDPGCGDVDYGIKADDVDAVLLTHNHFDHSANARLFGNAEVFAHEKDIAGLVTGFGIYAESFGETFSPLRVKPLPEKIFGLDVIFTPGHTPGSVCFLEKNEEVLFSGDTVFADGVGRTDLLGGDGRTLFKSLEKIESLAFSHLMPGHGPLGTKSSVVDGLRFLKQLDNRR
jgi:glyoxylase-like metal-dependent hydrolase (beta-lactamase superfamily II)